MLGFLSALAAPFSGIVTSIINYFSHSKTMAEITKQKELEIEKTKVELAKEAQTVEQLIALEGLKAPLGDKGFRRFLVVITLLPFILLLPDMVGFSQYGSQLVLKYFNLVNSVIPMEYKIFITSMVGGYFGIVKVKETFFGGKK